MKPKNRILFRLTSLLTVLALLLTFAPIQPAFAGAGNTTYYHYSDVAPAQFEVGQFNQFDMTYGEGEVMPHAVKITGLTAGTEYGMWIDYYYKKSNTCGFAYITQYDYNVRINPITLLDGQTAASLIANGSLSTANEGRGGMMYTVGVTAGSVTVGMYTEDGTQLDRYVPVRFTASASTAYFYFGFKLAEDGDCGVGTQGIADFSGGSHETRITETNLAGQTAFGLPAARMVDADGPIKIQTGYVSSTIFRGQKWYDVDGNTAIHIAEPFLAGWSFQLYNCGSSSTCATKTLISTNSTGLDGTYVVYKAYNITAGPYYQVCEIPKSGWTLTFPITTTPYCSAPINYTGTTVSQNFGNNRVDWGDLPQGNYPTTLAVTGARHLQYPDTNADGKPESWNGQAAVWLGAIVDSEIDGQPNLSANGDGADEDGFVDANGITFTALIPGMGYGTMNVVLNSSDLVNPVSGTLAVWFDWNNDGDFNDTGEANIYPVTWTGMQTITNLNFTLPTLPDTFYFRARLYPGTVTPSYTGAYLNGEVEDYYFSESTAVDVSELTTNASASTITVNWQTFSEIDILGFNLYRSTNLDPTQVLVSSTPAQHPGKMLGDTYQYLDSEVEAYLTYTYWLEVQMKDGSRVLLDPATASLQVDRKMFLPVIQR